MRIRMRKTTPGAVNGIAIKKFEKDAVYEVGLDVPEHLASAFMSMGVAVEVKGAPEDKAKESHDKKSEDADKSVKGAPEDKGEGRAPEEGSGKGDAPSQDDIIAAIELLDPNNPEHYTRDGYPQVKAIEDILKANISADDRFHAFEEYKKRQEASVTGPDFDKSVKGAPEDKGTKKKEDEKK